MQIPRVTQILDDLSISDYKWMAANKPEQLAIAAELGSGVHSLCADFDTIGWLDPSWIKEREKPYFEAWQRYRQDVPLRFQHCEELVSGHVNGLPVQGHPDRWAAGIVRDIKTCASKDRSWELQTAMYAWICGMPMDADRGVVQLLRTGKYKLHQHENQHDMTLAAAAATLWYFRFEDRRKTKKAKRTLAPVKAIR